MRDNILRKVKETETERKYSISTEHTGIALRDPDPEEAVP